MDTNTNTKKCCPKACAISFIAVYAFMMLYAFVVHGHLLTAEYEATSSLWRAQADMERLAPLCWILHAVLAMAFVCLFKKFKAGVVMCRGEALASRCPIKSGGLCFGLKLGIILGVVQAAMYIHMPIPESLAIKWFLSEFFMGLGIGAVLGMTYKAPITCDTKAA